MCKELYFYNLLSMKFQKIFIFFQIETEKKNDVYFKFYKIFNLFLTL